MKTRKKPKTDAVPAIGDRLLTLREAADVLRLSTRTMREYVQRGAASTRAMVPREVSEGVPCTLSEGLYPCSRQNSMPLSFHQSYGP